MRSSSSTATPPRPTCGAMSCRTWRDWAASSPATSSAWGRRASFPTPAPAAITSPNSATTFFALWDALDLGDNVVLVLHDWGSALGFHWANQHRDRVAGIAFMEGIVKPITWDEFPRRVRPVFEGFAPRRRGDGVGAQHVRRGSAAGAIMRTLTDEEMDHYRAPFARARRRPTAHALVASQHPDRRRAGRRHGDRARLRCLAGNQHGAEALRQRRTGLTDARGGPGLRADLPQPDGGDRAGHALHQEDSPHEIGTAIAQFVQELRR